MAKEEFTVRITPKGEILVEVDDLPPHRVKDLIKYLEETIGPMREIEVDRPDGPGQVKLEDISGRSENEQAEEEEISEKSTYRLRLRRKE